MVIRYAYLWRAEAGRGLEEGQKDRPCAIVLAHRRQENGDTTVVVAPITHQHPTGDPDAIAIPWAVKRRIGLDDEPSWIITNDVNSFVWPGPDLRSVDPRTSGSGFVYGFLPENLAKQLVSAIRMHMRQGTFRPVQRTE